MSEIVIGGVLLVLVLSYMFYDLWKWSRVKVAPKHLPLNLLNYSPRGDRVIEKRLPLPDSETGRGLPVRPCFRLPRFKALTNCNA